MNVLYLGVPPFPLTPIIQASGCRIIECDSKVDVDFLREHQIDFAVSFRCPHMIRKPIIEYLSGNIINLHISLLPWNRGSDPNLWSFLEDTPKGVTIHYIDEGLDTGKMIVQKKIVFDDNSGETLTTTYNRLNTEIITLFEDNWSAIMRGEIVGEEQSGVGSKHMLKDKEPFLYLLEEKGWNTPISELIHKAVR